MSQNKISIQAVGDIVPDCDDPFALFALAMPTLKRADILFGQMEVPFTSDGGGLQMHNYHARRVGPEKVSSLVSAGFDVMSFAGNHALDQGEKAFLNTIETLRKNEIGVIGVGRNIAEAREPWIVERNGTRIAFLAYCSVLPKGYNAGPERPGCNPIRVATYYEQVDWQPGTPPKIITIPNKDDVAAMIKDIGAAKSRADVVIVSMHWGVHLVPAMLAMYQKEVGHAAIDAGADLIIGHHPHILKAIEVYKGKAIFYSIGNFIVPSKPDRKSEGLDLYKVKADPEYPGYRYPVDARKTLIAQCVVANKKIESVSFFPALINKQVQPEVLPQHDERFDEVVKYLKKVTSEEGIEATNWTVDADEVFVCK
jgi:poly-gamma-glutamate capsule biosynthesis protein CapA/YwtB (metallophosphatase superfamily)